MQIEKANIAFSDSIKVAKNKVLVAPLNWGLGHATRCVPIIRFLIENGFSPVLASDGVALELLKKEFPELPTIVLPSYNIQYSKYTYLTKWKLLFSFRSIKKAVDKEHKKIDKLVSCHHFIGLISDNRFGVYHKDIPSVYMTHQLCVFSGFTTWLTSKIHKNIIFKYDECWVPDFKGGKSLSGRISSVSKFKIPIKFLGPLSRLELKNKKIDKHVLLLLSGPEPQRSILETKLLKEFTLFKGRVLLVRGVLDDSFLKNVPKNIEVVNYLTSKKLALAINSSELVLARSGYSTIMDLAKLKKKAFFIPTPGQGEQEYLANYLEQKKIAPFCKQEQFDLNMLSRIQNYSGFIDDYQSDLNPDLLLVFKKD